MQALSFPVRPLMLGAVVAMAVFTSGCADNQLVYGDACITCLNNPLSGQPLNYDPKQHPNGVITMGAATQSQASGSGLPLYSSPASLGTDQYQLTYRGNVDTAAALIKDAFGFVTQAEAIAQSGSYGGKFMFSSGDYAYSATPGAFYLMKRNAYSGKLTAKISKTSGGAKVLLSYNQTQQGQQSLAETMSRIKQVAEKTLR